jgi:signal transduction histidine kinase
MQQSIDLLLMLAREERARSPSAHVPLLPLVEKIVLAESARHDAGDFEVTVAVPADCTSRVDARVAAAIIGNLIANVFQHTRPGRLGIAVEGTDLLISDSGEGIPAEMLQSISEDCAAPKLRGLGLSIVSRLCRVHRIPLRIEPTPAGTRVAVGLLLREGPPSRSPASR